MQKVRPRLFSFFETLECFTFWIRKRTSFPCLAYLNPLRRTLHGCSLGCMVQIIIREGRTFRKSWVSLGVCEGSVVYRWGV